MACATPVVGVYEGGVRESVISGVTGLLAQRDPFEFAEAIQRVLRDSAWAQELGNNGLRHIQQQWTWEATVARVERALALVCQRKGRSEAPCV